MNSSNKNIRNYLEDRADALYKRIIESEIAKPEQIRGCNESEIAEIEAVCKLATGSPLPYSYKVFLRKFGRGSGGVGRDLTFWYPNPLSLTKYSREIEQDMKKMLEEEGTPELFEQELLLPPNAFVFASKEMAYMWFFEVEEGVEDPRILFHEGEDNFDEVCDSILDFWEAEIELIKQIIARSKEIEKQ